MKRPNNLVSTSITVLVCFGGGFILSSSLSKSRLDRALEKASAGDAAMDVVVQTRRREGDLYGQVRVLNGKLKAAKGRVTVVRVPARVVTRLEAQPPARPVETEPKIGKLASLSSADAAPTTPITDYRKASMIDRKSVFNPFDDKKKDQKRDVNYDRFKEDAKDQIREIRHQNHERSHDQNEDQNHDQNRGQNGDGLFNFVFR